MFYLPVFKLKAEYTCTHYSLPLFHPFVVVTPLPRHHLDSVPIPPQTEHRLGSHSSYYSRFIMNGAVFEDKSRI